MRASVFALFLGGCIFEPDLSRYPRCADGARCPVGFECWEARSVCLPSCGEEGGCQVGALRLLATPMPDAVEGKPYVHRFHAEGGVPPLEFRLEGSSLPGGLTLAPDGTVTGSSVVIGSFEVDVTVRDGASSPSTTQARYALAVRPELRFATAPRLSDAVVGQNYSESLYSTGGAGPRFEWSLAPGAVLPSGLTLEASGVLRGVPSDVGLATFDVVVVDSGAPPQRVTKKLELQGTAPPLTLTLLTRALADGRVASSYRQDLRATSGTGALSWRITDGALPSGITLNPLGYLHGTPELAGTFSVTVRVNDSAAQQVERPFTLTVH